MKHQNADVLSRFPQPSTRDNTGARLDVEGLPDSFVAAMAAIGSKRRGSSIDEFCPKASDLLGKGTYFDANYYANAAMDPTYTHSEMGGEEVACPVDAVRVAMSSVILNAKDTLRK